MFASTINFVNKSSVPTMKTELSECSGCNKCKFCLRFQSNQERDR